jgi:hypothetical protein
MRPKRVVQPWTFFGNALYLGDVEPLIKNRRCRFLCSCGVIFQKELLFFVRKKDPYTNCGNRAVHRTGTNHPAFKHGHSSNPSGTTTEYRSYTNAKNRCTNENCEKYPIYGGRGITFKWSNFENFILDMGYKPTPKHQLDRIDNNGDYEKNNCRWATATENVRNRSIVAYADYNGNKIKVAELAEILNLSYKHVWGKIMKNRKNGMVDCYELNNLHVERAKQ